MHYEEEEQWRLLARVGAYIVLPALVLFIAGIIGLIWVGVQLSLFYRFLSFNKD